MRLLRTMFPALCLFLGVAEPASAQLGHYLNVWGGPQIVALQNRDDFSSEFQDHSTTRLTTWRAGFGLDYIYNFAPSFGFQTGLMYSQNGQKYEGHIDWDGNFTDTTRGETDYSSHVFLNYLRVPVLIRFNSVMDPVDRVNMSIFAGLYIGYLTGVQEVFTSPAVPDSIMAPFRDFDYTELFHRIDFGFTAGMQINVRITKNFGTFAGVRFDRGLIDMENQGFAIQDGMPVEFSFPVSTKKLRYSDAAARWPTNNNTINFFVGLSFRLASAPEPVRRRPVEPAE